MKKLYFAVLFLLISILAGCKDQAAEVSLSTEIKNEITTGQECISEHLIYVYINGAVKHPGVYPVKEGSRIFTVIEQAGGFTEKAKEECLNQAEPVSDGQEVRVLTKKEYQRSRKQDYEEAKETVSASRTVNKININTAPVQDLMTLPGIGQTKAAAIIEYRDKNGSFTEMEQIKNVSGIGDATFSKLKDMITVN